jgi:hypothetical protein
LDTRVFRYYVFLNKAFQIFKTGKDVMKRSITTLLMALLLLPVPNTATAGGWQKQIIETTTKSTRIKKVWTENEAGHRFRLLRGETGPVYAALVLPESGQNQLGTREPRYQVDDGPLRLLADYGMFLDMSTRIAEWPVWDGLEPPCSETETIGWREEALCEILQGRRIEFHYDLVTGESRKTVFSLDGARKAIESTLF